jgi:hypothetical protein
VPVCNNCKKSSNCLTIDPCDHCGAKDWDQKTVLHSRASQPPLTAQAADNIGCLALVVLAAIGFGIYYFFSMSESEQLSLRYSIPGGARKRTAEATWLCFQRCAPWRQGLPL